MTTISLFQLALLILPALFTIWLSARWGIPARQGWIALARMFGQLILVGYVLLAVLSPHSWYLGGLALVVMSLASTWIALGSVGDARRAMFLSGLSAITLSCGAMLLWVWFVLLRDDPYQPRVLIPLASMAFSNAMNSLSIAAERYQSEVRAANEYPHRTAFRAAMIPISNSLLAVGVVSLPGMMTGQIIAGVSPLIAARYQIMVMLLLFSSSGLAAWLFLSGIHKKQVNNGGEFA